MRKLLEAGREHLLSRPRMVLGDGPYYVLVVALAAAVTLLLLSGLRESSLGGRLAETYGRIYVESPEVYTRQRLVNDRYQQEAWLNDQIAALNSATTLIEGYRSEAASATLEVSLDQLVALVTGRANPAPSAGTSGDEDDQSDRQADQQPWNAPDPDQKPVAFQTEFALRAAARDKLRQLLLENALDDRHDLTGNTVYGLKFDTVVVPGSNTTRSPAVIVEMPPAPFAGKSPEEMMLYTTIPPIVTDETLRQVERHYKNWLGNIETRLNRYVLGSCGTEKAMSIEELPMVLEYALYLTPTEAQAAQKALEANKDKLKSEQKNVTGSQSLTSSLGGIATVNLSLPEQWSSNASINAHISDESIVSFDVQSRVLPLFIMEEPIGDSIGYFVGNIEDSEGRVIRKGETLFLSYSCNKAAEGSELLNCNLPSGADADLRIYVPSLDHQVFRDAFAESVPGFAKVVGQFPASTFKFGEKAVSGWLMSMDVGLHTFLERARQVESYSYAAFPRGDVEGVVVDAFKSVDLGVAGPVSIEAGQSQRAGGVRAEPRLLNFSGGGAQDDDGTKKGFDFGWTIVRPDLQSPALASQLVLVSVPAYSDRLTLKVTTGWLDRDHVRRGAWTDLSLEERLDRLLVGTDRLTMEVSLPPDYDAIDNMMLPGTSRLGPAIDEVSLCNEKLHVAAGQPVDIVIPGERLWRSTVVTLGGQRASEIRVLPDMRGIIASFAGVDRPLADPSATVTGQPGGDSAFVAASGGPAEPVAVTLFVWTSQGADSLRDYVLVHPGSDGPNAQSTDVLATGQ